VTFGAWAAALG